MIKRFLRKWLGVTPAAQAPIADVRPMPRTILWRNMAMNMPGGAAPATAPKFEPPKLPAGVVDPDVKFAQDSACGNAYAYANAMGCDAAQMFPGYSNLAQQAQRPEFRRISEIIAGEMVREWIKITGSPDDTRKQKVAEIETALEQFNVREIIREALEHDGFFGAGHIYIDVKTPDGLPARASDDELKTPLTLTPNKIQKGSLVGFTNVEPQWCYPYEYNSIDPLSPNFYKPQSWFVVGKLTHASRLMTLVTRQVPDILKPAYNFGGLSLTQIADPYVSNWLRTRDSVGDLIHSFSINGVKTDLSSLLESGASCDLATRLALFTAYRDNKGVFVMDNSTEDFFQFNVPLSTLDKLQAQAQEQICSVSGLPLVKYTGITPSGLNASSEGEIRVFYDWIASQQSAHLIELITTMLTVIQLHLFGEIDPDIGFEFIPLYQLSAEEVATVNKTKAETDGILIENGQIMPDEARVALQSDPERGYGNLDLSVEVELPTDPDALNDNEEA